MIKQYHAALVGLVFLLASCSFIPGLEPDATPAQRLLGLQSNYATAFVLVTKYENLPRCSNAEAPVTCSKQDVADNMRKTHDAVKESFKAAWKVVWDVKSTESAQEAALAAASAVVDNARNLYTAYTAFLED